MKHQPPTPTLAALPNYIRFTLLLDDVIRDANASDHALADKVRRLEQHLAEEGPGPFAANLHTLFLRGMDRLVGEALIYASDDSPAECEHTDHAE